MFPPRSPAKLLTTRSRASEAGRSSAPPSPALEAIRSEHRLPGLVAARIALHGDGEDITARATGRRKIGDDAALTTNDTFYLASLTKAMTSTLVAILINDDGNSFTWNSTIPEAFSHIENILPEYEDTTLAMLGAHVAGLDDEVFVSAEPDLWKQLVEQSVTPTEGRRLIAEHVFSRNGPVTAPGGAFLYSNTGYALLGHLVDTHAEGSWEAFIKDALFDPLGMDGCGIGPVPQGKLPAIENPWPHYPSDQDPRPAALDAEYLPAISPAGSAHCTIDSYARFLSLHMDGFLGRDTPLLPAEAFRALHTPYATLVGLSPSGERPDRYAPGAWEWADSPDVGRYFFHDGGNNVNQALGVVAPEAEEAYFVGTNIGFASETMHEVAEGLFSGALGF